MVREIARQQLGRRFADMADAQRIDETVERNVAARVDRGDQIFDHLVFLVVVALRFDGLPLAFLGAPLRAQGRAMRAQGLADEFGLFGQPENIGRLLDQSLLVEQLDIGAAEPFDVEGVAPDEMLEPFDRLRRADQPARAAAIDIHLAGLLVYFAHGMAAADGTFVGELIGLGAPWAAFRGSRARSAGSHRRRAARRPCRRCAHPCARSRLRCAGSRSAPPRRRR